MKLSALASNAVVNTIAELIDGGGVPGRIELLSDDGRILAALTFAKPCAAVTEDGQLTFAPIIEDPSARSTGKAVTARIVDGTGNEIFSGSVSDLKGGGLVQLNTNQLVSGGPVRIRTFTLSI